MNRQLHVSLAGFSQENQIFTFLKWYQLNRSFPASVFTQMMHLISSVFFLWSEKQTAHWPCMIRQATTSVCPCRDAYMSGVSSHLSSAFTDAPQPNSSSTIFSLPWISKELTIELGFVGVQSACSDFFARGCYLCQIGRRDFFPSRGNVQCGFRSQCCVLCDRWCEKGLENYQFFLPNTGFPKTKRILWFLQLQAIYRDIHLFSSFMQRWMAHFVANIQLTFPTVQHRLHNLSKVKQNHKICFYRVQWNESAELRCCTFLFLCLMACTRGVLPPASCVFTSTPAASRVSTPRTLPSCEKQHGCVKLDRQQPVARFVLRPIHTGHELTFIPQIETYCQRQFIWGFSRLSLKKKEKKNAVRDPHHLSQTMGIKPETSYVPWHSSVARSCLWNLERWHRNPFESAVTEYRQHLRIKSLLFQTCASFSS